MTWVYVDTCLMSIICFFCMLSSVTCVILHDYVSWCTMSVEESIFPQKVNALSYWLHCLLWGLVKTVIISKAEAWGPLNEIRSSDTLFSTCVHHRGPANIDPQNNCTSISLAHVFPQNTSTQIYMLFVLSFCRCLAISLRGFQQGWI